MKLDKQFLIYFGILVVLTVAVFSPAYHGAFIWDDDLHVSENMTLRDAKGLGDIWFDLGSFPQYYPLTMTNFWIDYHLWGLDTSGYHVENILIHALNAVLVWLLLARLGVPAAWLIAAVFALHPVQVETAAWISERKNTLSTLFYLAAMLAAVLYFRLDRTADSKKQESPTRQSSYLYASLLFFLLSLLSKTVTATLPAVILLIMWWKNNRITLRDILLTAPFFVIGIGMGILSVFMEKHYVGASGETWNLSYIERCLVAGRALWFYMVKLIAPYSLSFSYPRWDVDSSVWWQYLFPLAVLILMGVLWFMRKRIGRGPMAGFLFFAGTLFPALGFFDVYPFQYSFVADHFQYLAGIGIMAVAVTAVYRYFEKIGFSALNMRIAAVLLLAVLSVLSWRQAHIYRDKEILWQDTLRKNPDSWMANNNLGIYYYLRGDFTRAVDHYRKALEIRPAHAKAHFNLGDSLARLGRYDEAIAHYRESEKLNPEDLSVHINLGNAFKGMGRFDDAVAEYKKAIGKNSDFAEGYYNLGLAQMGADELEPAIENFKKAVSLKPDYAEAYNNLGSAYFKSGRLSLAAENCKKAIAIKPDHAYAHYNLALILSNMGNLKEAVTYYNSALRYYPNFASAHYNLGIVLQRLGRTAEAQKHLEMAKKLGR